MEYDHSRRSSSAGLIREGSHTVDDQTTAFSERKLQHLIGADYTSHPPQYRRILAAAEADGYRAELITEDGVLNICRHGRVLMRIRLSPDNLAAGLWEDKLAAVFAQSRLMRLIEQNGVLRAARQSRDLDVGAPLLEEVKRILGVPRKCELKLRLLAFPGARQLQALVDDAVAASLIYNPVLKLVLEFRIDPAGVLEIDDLSDKHSFIEVLDREEEAALLQACREELASAGIEGAAVNEVRREINLIGEDALRGLLRLSGDSRIRVLALGESHFGFGDPNRRGALRLMRKMRRSGITHFAIPLCSDESPRLEQALEQQDVRRFWLAHAAERACIQPSPEWTAMLQRAHDIGLKVTAVGRADQGGAGPLVKRIERILDAHPDYRVLLWLENTQLARSIRTQSSIGVMLKQQLGLRQVVTVATMSRQLPGAPLKLLTEGPSPAEGLMIPVLLRMAEAPAIRRLPWSAASAHDCGAWDYLLLYPGVEQRFRPL